METVTGDLSEARRRVSRRWLVVFIPGPEWQPAANYIEAGFNTRAEADTYLAAHSKSRSGNRAVVRGNRVGRP